MKRSQDVYNIETVYSMLCIHIIWRIKLSWVFVSEHSCVKSLCADDENIHRRNFGESIDIAVGEYIQAY